MRIEEFLGGKGVLIRQILRETRGQNLETQWAALQKTLTEAGRAEEEFPATKISPTLQRRKLTLPQGLIIRLEPSPCGYLLRFSGPEAKRGGLKDDVMDAVERLFVHTK